MVFDRIKIFKRHTVYPTWSREPVGKTPLPKGPYGSWCTPDGTPTHTVLTPSNSNIASNVQIKDGTIDRNESSILPVQKIRLVSFEPLTKYKSEFDIDNCKTEIEKKIQSYEIKRSPKKEPSDLFEKIIQVVDTPQSPVPTSPSKPKEFSCFKLPPVCDPYMPIDPQGRAYIAWLLLVTFCYSYNAWCIALRATFPYQTPENTLQWLMADYLSDAVYLLDVFFVKPRLIFLFEGFWVDDPIETRNNYHKKLQFKFDLISLLPLDILYLYFGTGAVILRFPRLLKLQTFWEFHRAMDRMLSCPYMVRIGKTLFYIFYLIHLNACAYYAMSKHIGLGSNGWVYDNKGNAYIRCFYFATKTATSIGKNPKPENTLEFLYMTVAWLMGVFVFALLISQIRDIITTISKAKIEYRKTVDGCRRYLRSLNMPPWLQHRVTCWFTYTRNQQRCFDEMKILNSLPTNMKRDVSLEVHITTLSKVQLFSDCSTSLLRDLVLQLRPVSFLPGDAVVRRGDVGHQMYIVKSGECCVMSADEREVLARLGEGSVFGEISLLGLPGLRRRTATVRSRGYSNLFALSKSDLDAALKFHNEAAKILRLRADQIIRENAARQAVLKTQARKPSEDTSTLRRRSVGEGRRSRSVRQSKKKLRFVLEDEEDATSMGDTSASTGMPLTPLPKIVIFPSD